MKSPLKKYFKKILNGMELINYLAATSCLFIMFFISLIEVAARYLFNYGFVWAMPLNLMLFSYLTFLGASVIYFRKKYIIVQFLFNKFSRRTKYFVELIIHFLMLGFLIFLIIEIPSLMIIQNQNMQVLPLPRYVLSLPLFFGAIFIFLQLFYELWELFEEKLWR